MRVALASKKDAFRRAIARYMGECRGRGLSPFTLESYGRALRAVHRALVEADAVRGPTVFGKEQATIAYEALHGSRVRLTFLNVFLRHHENRVLERMGLIRPPGPPVRRWLDLEAGDDLLVYDAAMQMGPPWSTLVHLELKLLFRRISCMRARLSHFHANQVVVHGKGRHGGKFYGIAPHSETARILGDNEAWRRRKIAKARRVGFEGEPEDFLFLAGRGRRIGPYRAVRTFDDWLHRVEEESGVEIGGHHTLRRTGGRKLWVAGVRIETISRILGHESLNMTIRYLGINISDMEFAQRRLIEYETSQRLVRVANRENETP